MPVIQLHSLFRAALLRVLGACGLAVSLLFATSPWAAPLASSSVPISQSGTIAVIYPDLGEPYRSVFMQIISGIEQKARGRVISVPIAAEVNAVELNDSLRRQGVQVAIALGRQGMKAASMLDRNIDVVVGGVLAAQQNEVRNMQVNILSPDPSLLFSRLKEMMPKARKVYVVYDPRQNSWMIQIAKEAARAHGLELETYEAQDLRTAMRAYQQIIGSADPRQDALWLPQDSVSVEESTALPMVLQESWARNLTVFSSSYGHVKRGALFSLYPDNVELGRRLAVSAMNELASGGSKASAMSPLREVLIAVNLRTAKHLGINAGGTQAYDKTFPEQ